MSLSINKWLYLGVGGLIVTGLVWVGFFYDRGSRIVPTVEKSTGVAMEIEGLKYSNYKDGKLQSRVQAAQLMVVPRKIGVFQIQSINEAVISRFRLEMHSATLPDEPNKTGTALPDELSDGIKGLATIKGAGRIVKVTIAGMEILSLRGDKPEFILQARVGSFDARHKQLQLENVIMQQPGNHLRLTTDRAVWNKEINAFEVPGSYVLQRGNEVTKGERIFIDLAFRIIRDKKAKKKT
jgi:hypothetical protein